MVRLPPAPLLIDQLRTACAVGSDRRQGRESTAKQPTVRLPERLPVAVTAAGLMGPDMGKPMLARVGWPGFMQHAMSRSTATLSTHRAGHVTMLRSQSSVGPCQLARIALRFVPYTTAATTSPSKCAQRAQGCKRCRTTAPASCIRSCQRRCNGFLSQLPRRTQRS